jgi:mannose/fructose/N-acetylgalactosamine-specific phosphotransferase system component IIC
LLDISTIFNVAEMPDPTPENMAVGLVTHLTLSMMFGIGFALLLPLLRNGRQLVLGAVGYGVALYLINFQILGRIAFPWFQEGPDQVFELVAHALFGLMLVPFFVGMRPRDAV